MLNTSVHPSTTSVDLSGGHPPDASAWTLEPEPGLRTYLCAHLDECVPLLRHRERFLACGSNAWVQWSRSRDAYRVAADGCNLRWCPRCARRRAGSLRRAVGEALKAKPTAKWRMVTLTRKHSDRPLRDQLDDLKACYRKLRHRKWWKARVRGSLAVIEITRSSRTGTWHPHIHVLADSLYLLHSQLSDQWQQVTKDSHIVHVRLVRSADKAAEYLGKYLSKTIPSECLQSPQHVAEYITAVQGSRMLIRGGWLIGADLSDPHDGPLRDWSPICSVARLLQYAATGDDWAVAVVGVLSHGSGSSHPSTSTHRHPP